MKKLRLLILFSSWIGFYFLGPTLKSEGIPRALRDLTKGSLAQRWIHQLQEKESILPNEDSVKDFYRKTIIALP